MSAPEPNSLSIFITGCSGLSDYAKNILSDWQTYLPKFWKVAPKFAASEDGAMVIARKHLKKFKRDYY